MALKMSEIVSQISVILTALPGQNMAANFNTLIRKLRDEEEKEMIRAKRSAYCSQIIEPLEVCIREGMTPEEIRKLQEAAKRHPVEVTLPYVECTQSIDPHKIYAKSAAVKSEVEVLREMLAASEKKQIEQARKIKELRGKVSRAARESYRAGQDSRQAEVDEITRKLNLEFNSSQQLETQRDNLFRDREKLARELAKKDEHIKTQEKRLQEYEVQVSKLIEEKDALTVEIVAQSLRSKPGRQALIASAVRTRAWDWIGKVFDKLALEMKDVEKGTPSGMRINSYLSWMMDQVRELANDLDYKKGDDA